MRKYIGTILLAAALAGSSAACAGQLRVYDSPGRDHYRWDSGEERYYRAIWPSGGGPTSSSGG